MSNLYFFKKPYKIINLYVTIKVFLSNIIVYTHNSLFIQIIFIFTFNAYIIDFIYLK